MCQLRKTAVKLLQIVTLGCCSGTSTNAYGVSMVQTRHLWLLTTPESVKCPKHSVKPFVRLFHLAEYQIRKILAEVEVRRFQFLIMLKLVGIPFQGYSQCSPDTSVRHSSLPRNFSSIALPMCRNRRHGLHCLLYCRGNSSGC